MSGEEHTRAAASAVAVTGSASPSGGVSNGDATKQDAAPQAAPLQKSGTPAAGTERAEEPKQARAPKLAPAPVPQQTPWKAPPIDASVKPPIDAVEVAQQKRSEQREANKPRESKRSTTGKEKWVPYTPAPAPPSQSGPTSSSGSQRGKPARRGGNAPYRGQRRSDRGDKRQLRSQSGSPAPQAAQKHHARSQSAVAPGTDEADKLEKLSLDDSQRRGPSNASYRGSAPSNSQGSSNSNSPANSAGSSTANTPAPQHSRKRDHPRKVPFYQPGFVPMGYPMQMMRMPMPAATMPPGVAPGVAATDPATYMFNALVAQVDYYFSVENLCKDMYLRKQMNDQGLVPVSTIGAFNRVKSMAPNTDVVVEACRWAPNVELVGSKVRVAKDWQQWVMPRSERLGAGLDNSSEPTEETPKFQVEQAKPFVPKNQ